RHWGSLDMSRLLPWTELLSAAYNRRLSRLLRIVNRRRACRTRRKAEALIGERLFHRRKKKEDVGTLAGVAHQADSPDFFLHGTKPAGDFDIEFLEQLPSHFAVFNSGRNINSGDGDEPVGRIGNKKFEAHGFESSDQGLLILDVTFPSSLKSFVENGAERFAQAINQTDGRSMMIESLLTPVTHRGRQIKVPTAHRLLAGVHDLFHARAHGDRRHSGRGAERLLGSTKADVDSLCLNIQGNASEGGDGIDHEQCAEFVGYFAVILNALDDARGGFSVREANEFNFPALAGAKNVRRIDGAAIRRLDANHLGGYTLRDDGHSLGKSAIHTHDALVARLQRVHDSRFDPAGTRSGNRKGDAIVRAKDLTQKRLNIVHHARKPRVHMANERRSHRTVNARIHTGRAGRKHQSVGRKKFADHFLSIAHDI